MASSSLYLAPFLLALLVAQLSAHSPPVSAPSTALGLRPAAMRGGRGLVSSSKLDTFYDLDGTIYDGTMAHCVWNFIKTLPNPFQRASKALQFLVTIPFIAITAGIHEATACAVLGKVALRGVKVEDAETANLAVSQYLAKHVYPEVIDHLKLQQIRGRKVAVLSGNLSPLISRFCKSIGCETIATDMLMERGVYTGKVRGVVCVEEEKRQRVREIAGGLRLGLKRQVVAVGVGNSKYDIPFLEEAKQAWVVRPSKRLRRKADHYGWQEIVVARGGILGVGSKWGDFFRGMEGSILAFWGGLAMLVSMRGSGKGGVGSEGL